MTKFLNISTDTTLGGSSASDEVVSSQKALKTYIDNNSGSYTAGTGIDITSNTISVKDPVLINKSTQQNSYIVSSYSSGLSTTIKHSVSLGYGSEPKSGFSTAIGSNSATASGVSGSGQTAIGYGSFVGGSGSIAIGYQATAGGSPSNSAAIAIGDRATAIADYAIQLGFGSNSEANSLYVGTSSSNNWKMLGGDGLIPVARISYDNSSITANSSNKLQTVGIIDQNDTSTALKQWSGTKVQYDAIVSKDANTVYNITDDTNPTQALLEAIYPVGSIYIGTMAICPMSALFGTWELVSGGRVLQGADSGHVAGSTIEAGLPNIYTEIATRKYQSGVGTIASVSGAGTFENDGYTAVSNVYTSGNASSVYSLQKTTVDASVGNSIYGNSTTVQPPAFVVNIWQRTQ